MTNHKQLLSLYGLKWNPFSPDLPSDGLVASSEIELFAWRIEQLTPFGGFALVTGDPGTGKSAALRLLHKRLGQMRELTVASLNRPQSRLSDFYRELGSLFGVDLKAHNAYGGFQALRERWRLHAEASLLRPVLIIDEAQEMPTATLSELRLLSSSEFDSKSLLTVVLGGDRRLGERFRTPELLPVGSRIRARLTLEPMPRDELVRCLSELMTLAGNPALMTKELVGTVAEHAAGNYRVATIMAADLLISGVAKGSQQLDEALFFDVFKAAKRKAKTQSRPPQP